MSEGDLGGYNGNNTSDRNNSTNNVPIIPPRPRSRSHSSQQNTSTIRHSNSHIEDAQHHTEFGVAAGDLISVTQISSPNSSLLVHSGNSSKENLQGVCHQAEAASSYYSNKNNYYCHTFGSGAQSSTTNSSGRQSRSHSQGRCHDILVQQQQGGTTPLDESNWLEQIQFKAQYQHFRSNNYASVVNSASSLDKVEVDLDANRAIHISSTHFQDKERSQAAAGESGKDRHGICWSFPRFNFRRIFNAKSLEDILGRNRKSQQQSIRQSCSHQHSPNQSHYHKNSGTCQEAVQDRSRSRQKSQSNSSLISSNKLLSTSPVQLLSTSSSENNCNASISETASVTQQLSGLPIFADRCVSGVTSSQAKSTFGSAAHLLSISPTAKDNSNSSISGGNNSSSISNKSSAFGYTKKPKSTVRPPPRVTCAKSDNCLNRIVASTSTFCTNRTVRSSVDNIDTTVSEQDTHSSKKNSSGLQQIHDPQYTHDTKPIRLNKHHSTSVVSSSLFGWKPNKVNPNTESENVQQTLPVITITNSRSKLDSNNPSDTKQLTSPSGNTTIFKTNPQEITIISPSQTTSSNMTKKHKNTNVRNIPPQSLKVSPKDKAQLVVANVSYLQRPVSPCRLNTSPVSQKSPNSANTFSTNNHNLLHQRTPQTAESYFYAHNQSPSVPSNPTAPLLPGSIGVFGCSGDNSSTVRGANSNYNSNFDCARTKQPSFSFSSNDNNNIPILSSNGVVGVNERMRHTSQADMSFFNHRVSGVDGVFGFNTSSSSTPPSLEYGIHKTNQPQPRSSGGPNYNFSHNKTATSTNDDMKTSHPTHQIMLRSDNKVHLQSGESPENQNISLGEQGDPSYYYQFHSLQHQEQPSLYTSEDSETGGGSDINMDLQSPHYVKRTAHMFNSRYTSQVNGSSGTTEHRISAERNPSYLNVSRSVCGYSCLSYNNGTTVTSNGSSSVATFNNGTPTAPPFPPKMSSIVIKSGRYNGEGDDSRENSRNMSKSPTPPPLPKTMAPKYSSNINMSDNENTTTSFGNGKSFIMQKIERLYGSDAVSSTGFRWRKSSPPCSNEKIIPISVEGRNNLDGNDKNQSWKARTKEQALYSTRRYSSKGSIIIQDDQEDSIKDVSGQTCPGSHRLLSSQNKIPVEELEGSINREMYTRDTESTLNSNVNNLHLNGNGQTHYESRYRTTNDSGLGDKDLDAEIDKEDKINNEDFNLSQRNGNLTNIGSIKYKLEPTGDASGSILFENVKPKSAVNVSADDSGLGEEDRLSFSAKAKPEPKPKPKDMALLRSLRSTEEIRGKTAAKISISNENSILVGDTTDSEATEKKSDIKLILQTSQKSPVQSEPVISKEESLPLPSEEPSSAVDVQIPQLNKENEAIVVKDGEYFLGVMKKATSQIESLIEKAEKEVEADHDPNSERAGRVRAAIGKANLLIKKKFKQFQGLCEINMQEKSQNVDDKPFQTKNEDLAGFWDMVLIQVEEIHSIFSDLEGKTGDSATDTVDSGVIKQRPHSIKKAASSRKVGSTCQGKTGPKTSVAAKSSAAAARDESRRKLLAEKRRALKNQNQGEAGKADEDEAVVQIFVPESAQTN